MSSATLIPSTSSMTASPSTSSTTAAPSNAIASPSSSSSSVLGCVSIHGPFGLLMAASLLFLGL